MAVVWGILNGIMVGYLNVNPVIATMGTMYAARGFAYLMARWDGGANISAGLPAELQRLRPDQPLRLPADHHRVHARAFAGLHLRREEDGAGPLQLRHRRQPLGLALSGIKVPRVTSCCTCSWGCSRGSAAPSRSRGSDQAFPTSRRAWSSTSWWPSSSADEHARRVGLDVGHDNRGLDRRHRGQRAEPAQGAVFLPDDHEGLLLIIAVFADQTIRRRG